MKKIKIALIGEGKNKSKFNIPRRENNFVNGTTKKYFCIFLLIFNFTFCLANWSEATDISGIISTDTTWTAAGSPYIVTAKMLVEQNVTLTIDPGVVVKISTGTYLRIDGTLKAEGTEANHIIFTSNKATPSPGDWQHIKFTDVSVDTGCIVKYCEIKYAEQGIQCYYASPIISHNTISNNDRGIYSDGGSYYPYEGSPSISHNTISNNYYGIECRSGGSPSIINNTIWNNGCGIGCYYMASPTISNNTIRGNTIGIISSYRADSAGNPTIINNDIYDSIGYNLENRGSKDITARNNWWGTTDTAEIDGKIFDYYDDLVYGRVFYTPFATEPFFALRPTISLSKSLLRFSATERGSNPANQTFMVTNGGASGSILNWTASDDITWLSLNLSSGTLSSGNSGAVTASVNIAGLSTGTYTGTITVSDSNATNSPQTISVTLEIAAKPKPAISLSKSSLSFGAVETGSNPADQTFTVTNSGASGSTLNWSASDDMTWLDLEPTSGSSTSKANSVTVSVNISGLSTGTYNGIITVSDSNATNSPRTISVNLEITAAPSLMLSVDKTSLDFGEVKRGESKTLSFNISNAGGGTLSGTTASDKDWIKVSPTTFESNSQVVNVTVDNSILDKGEGEYTGTVTITSNGGNATVSVRLLATCVTVKPHPFRLSSGKPLTFWGSGVVPYDTKINIYTLSGNLVKTIEETEGRNELYWDGTNNWNEKVVPGIYLYSTESPKEKNAGKITVIK